MNEQKSIVITGASTGIGKATALHLDTLGFKVYAGVRKETDAHRLEGEASANLQALMLDVTDSATIEEAAKTVRDDTEHELHGIINNAGIGISGVLEATPEVELRKVLEVNVVGLHAMTRAFLPLLKFTGGRVINIGSTASFMAGPGSSSYAASKYAVRAITDALRLEVQPFGISVSMIAPGAIESEIWNKAQEYKEQLRNSIAPELLEDYRMFIDAGDKMVKTIKPIPAIEVATAVEHALTSPKPQMEYLVGKDCIRAYKASRMPKKFVNKVLLKRIQKAAEL